MGVDACIIVEFKEPPTTRGLNALSDAILKKFDLIVDPWRDPGLQGCLARLDDLYEPDFFETDRHGILRYDGVPVHETVYELNVHARLYVKNYDRGPGLELAGLLLYLLKRPDIIRVWYDGDDVDTLDECTEDRAFAILESWLTEDTNTE